MVNTKLSVVVPPRLTKYFCRHGSSGVFPIVGSAQTLKHLHFKNIVPFNSGLQLQAKIARANLDLKAILSKVEQREKYILREHPNAILNDEESKILDQIKAMKPNPMILSFEFEPTYTAGKRMKKTITEDQLNAFKTFKPSKSYDIAPKFFQLERGGQITYHGPGQMVAYIILDLKSFHKLTARTLVSLIETATMQTLKDLRIGGSNETLNIPTKKSTETGIYTLQNHKIASIGIHVRRSITTHGVSINVNPDLSYMKSFEMCGSKDISPTSVLNERPELNHKITVYDISVKFTQEMAKLLGINKIARESIDNINSLIS